MTKTWSLGNLLSVALLDRGVWLSRDAFQPQLLCDSLTPFELSRTIVHDVSEGITQQKVAAQIQEKSAKFCYPLLVL